MMKLETELNKVIEIFELEGGKFQKHLNNTLKSTIQQLFDSGFSKDDLLEEFDYQRINTLIENKYKRENPIENRIEDINPEQFFDNKKLVPARVANKVVELENLITSEDTEEIYYYNKGIYQKGAKRIIKNVAEQLIGEKLTAHAFNEIKMHVEIHTYTPEEDFNSNIKLIHLQNGILNLDNYEITNFDPNYIATSRIPIIYDPEAKCEKIQTFLNEILEEDDVLVMQELFGYCLYKDYPIQKTFMFTGGGANGKSTLINLFKAFLGKENISAIALQDLETSRFAAGQLRDKMANLYPDLSSKAVAQISKLKAMTGGDMLTAETKFGKHFNFTNHAKMVFSCNELPAIKEDTTAVWRRWIIINFHNEFIGKKADPYLINKITTEEELSGLLNWGLEGLKRLLEQGRFSDNRSTEETRRHYIFSSDPVKAFCEDEIEEEFEAFIPKSKLYSSFIQFCKEHSLKSVSETSFVRNLKQIIPILHDGQKVVDGRKGVRVWFDIKLKNNYNKSLSSQGSHSFLSLRQQSEVKGKEEKEESGERDKEKGVNHVNGVNIDFSDLED